MAINPDPTAVMGRRIGAVAIDGAIVFVPWFADQMSAVHHSEKGSSAIASDYCSTYNDVHDEDGICLDVGKDVWYSNGNIAVAPEIFLLLVPFVMFVLLQGFTGWSLGKLATGIRVVQEDGSAPGLLRALVRWLFWLVDGPFTLYLVGLITSLTTTGHRRVGDMVAKTYVVRADTVGHPVVLPGDHGLGFTAPPGGSPYGGMPIPTAKPGPQWDEARGTYIQWDPEAAAWMQWSDTAKRWDPIPPQAVIPPPPIDAPPPPPLNAPPPPPPPPSS